MLSPRRSKRGGGKGNTWVTDPKAILEPKVGSEGPASYEPVTIIDVFKTTVSKHGHRKALFVKRNNSWVTWTWQEYYDDCMRFAKALCYYHVDMHKIVNILGFNSPEWFIANCGAILAGSIAAGIYATNKEEACYYVSDHSQAEVVVVENNDQLKKYKNIAGKLKNLKCIVMWDGIPDPDTVATIEKSKKKVYDWKSFLELGNDIPTSMVEDRGDKIMPGHCSTLIYTSGTTGGPKAVMISHDNVTWTTRVVFETTLVVNHEDRVVSYLPLSHIAAQIMDLHGPMFIGAQTHFALPDALKGSLKDTLCEVQPSIMFAVPRVWEKMQDAMVAVGKSSPALLQMISSWAKGIGIQKNKAMQYGESGSYPCGYSCANAIIFSAIKRKLGLSKVKACFTAAAPIAPETLWYFASLDIPIYEVFGQSECTGPHTVSLEGSWKIGYCGRPLAGTLSKIDPETQELRYAGRHIMMGYMFMDEQTKNTFDDEGYLRSGDVGEFDGNDAPGIPSPSGFMRITGRIKELIITAGGENVAPFLIEKEVKVSMPTVSQCMVIGDKRKFLAMLITLKSKVDKNGVPTHELDKESLGISKSIGSDATTTDEAAICLKWKKFIDAGIADANTRAISRAQYVQKWKLLLDDFSEHGKEMTATQKLKRNVVYSKYEKEIESFY